MAPLQAKPTSRLSVVRYTRIPARAYTTMNAIDMVSMAANTINTGSILLSRECPPIHATDSPGPGQQRYSTISQPRARPAEVTHQMGIVDWYIGLGLGQKIVVGLAVAVGLLLVSYFATLVFLSSAPSDRNSPQ